MFGAVRLTLLAIASLIFLTGAAVVVSGDQSAPFGGLWLVGLGGLGIVILLFERSRYRSEHAERARDPVGPGGGELGQRLDPRFKPTSELFRDPTTGHLMRVFADPATGERRYRAED
jgi:hypothetical protein